MIKCEVPQSWIFWPLRFLICINDLCTVCKNTIPVLFANDTNLFSSGLDATGIQHEVNHDLFIITEWLKANGVIKHIKRHITCVVHQETNQTWYIIKTDGEIIAEVTSSNFWDVIIDDKLNWKDHVSCVCRKVAPGLGVIIKTRKVLRNESPKSLYYSFIYPFLIYCNPVWGCACKTNIEPLLIFQKGLKNYHCCSSQIAFTAIVLSTEAFELWKNI